MLGKSQLGQALLSVFYLTQKAARESIAIIFYLLLGYDYNSES